MHTCSQAVYMDMFWLCDLLTNASAILLRLCHESDEQPALSELKLWACEKLRAELDNGLKA